MDWEESKLETRAHPICFSFFSLCIGQGPVEGHPTYRDLHVLCCHETGLRRWLPLVIAICLSFLFSTPHNSFFSFHQILKQRKRQRKKRITNHIKARAYLFFSLSLHLRICLLLPLFQSTQKKSNGGGGSDFLYSNFDSTLRSFISIPPRPPFELSKEAKDKNKEKICGLQYLGKRKWLVLG